MQARILNTPHVKRIYGTIEVSKGGDVERVITVETDLHIDATHPQHDPAAVDDLLGKLKDAMGDVFDRAVLKEQ